MDDLLQIQDGYNLEYLDIWRLSGVTIGEIHGFLIKLDCTRL